jgi:hypothetical protein
VIAKRRGRVDWGRSPLWRATRHHLIVSGDPAIRRQAAEIVLD